MINYLIKVFSFFIKEFHDVRRQPALMISLVGGPLLVLGAFGATFRSANPFVSTVLVWPENGIPGVNQEQAEKFIGSNFYLQEVTTDREKAKQMLENGEVDVIQIIPDVSNLGQPGSEERPEIQILSKTIDPNAESWIRSLAYGEMNFINHQLLATEAKTAQEKAAEVRTKLESTQLEFEDIKQNFNEENVTRIAGLLSELQPVLISFLTILPPESLAQANISPELSALYRDLEILVDDLDELQNALTNEDTLTQFNRLFSSTDEIQKLRDTISVFVDTPSEKIISPVKETYTNLRGSAYSLVVFYAPSVLALLVQQLAVTLASLGLVRERQMGSFEMFRVSPLKLSQILIGKAMAYVLYVTIAGIILVGLLTLLNVPLPVNIGQTAVLLIALATASVGIGFLISAVSRTDSQAIQLTMLFLLLSIFFTGFFLPIQGFNWPAWIIAALIPMTHAIEGFQDLMLAGTDLTSGAFTGLILIMLLSYGMVLLIMRRQYRKVLD